MDVRVGDQVTATVTLTGTVTQDGTLEVAGVGTIGLSWLELVGARVEVIHRDEHGAVVAVRTGEPPWTVR